jgi:hypothetical protein
VLDVMAMRDAVAWLTECRQCACMESARTSIDWFEITLSSNAYILASRTSEVSRKSAPRT